MPVMLAIQYDRPTERHDRMGLPSKQKPDPDTPKFQPQKTKSKTESQIRAERDAEDPERWDGLS